MAIDLLLKGPVPLHLYRHDLESFSYVLVYVCAVWDPILKKFSHLPDQWEHETLSVIGANKAEFLHNDEAYNELFMNAHLTLKALTLHAPQPGCVFQLTLRFEMAQLCANLVANFTRSLRL